MLVLIDESGDPGFKIVRGSSSHFVVAMVVFDDNAEAERTSTAIANLRERLRVKPEFKFAKSADVVRDAFFASICTFNFTVRALVVDKAAIYSERLRETPDWFYNYFLRMMLAHDDGTLDGARVKIDGSGDREFRRSLTTYLRHQLQAGKIDSFRFADSSRDNLIQLADMVAGAILRSYRDDRKTAGRWRQMLAHAGRLGNVWDFR